MIREKPVVSTKTVSGHLQQVLDILPRYETPNYVLLATTYYSAENIATDPPSTSEQVKNIEDATFTILRWL